jgi:hypothetical protein
MFLVIVAVYSKACDVGHPCKRGHLSQLATITRNRKIPMILYVVITP